MMDTGETTLKIFISIAVTAIYMLGASATYVADRERGRANCWENERRNRASSSLIVAVAWPLYTVLAGIATTMVASPAERICNSKSFTSR
jgi:hypothetical protein